MGRSLWPQATGISNAGSALARFEGLGSVVATRVTVLGWHSPAWQKSPNLQQVSTMITNSQVWVSELNSRPEIRSAFQSKTVRFYDTTLRDGEQTVGVVFSPQQKVDIARQLDELGVSRMEAGFPRVSTEDAEAIQLMSKANLKAELWGFSRAVRRSGA